LGRKQRAPIESGSVEDGEKGKSGSAQVVEREVAMLSGCEKRERRLLNVEQSGESS
jgi:hypothetical protein